MNKFQKAQLWSSFVPFWSTLFVAVATYIDLTRKRVKMKYWAVYAVIFFISFLVLGAVNRFLLTGENLWINFLTSGLILFGTNYALVKLQLYVAKVNDPRPFRRFPVHAIWIPCLITVVAFIVVIVVLIVQGGSRHIEDINKESTELAVITQEDVITESWFVANWSNTDLTGNQTQVNQLFDQYDYDTINRSIKKLSGVMILQATQVESGTVTLQVETKLLEGNAELYVVIDGQIYTQLPLNEVNQITLTDVDNKLILVKLAAESANVQISVSRIIQ